MACAEPGGRCGRRPAAAACTGFTLIEVTVAVSLVAVILLGMLSAMRTLGGTAERVDALVERSEQMRAAVEFLRASLAVVQGPPPVVAGATVERPSLQGGPQGLEWIGLFPARYGAGGMHRFLLELDSQPQGGTLTIHFAARQRERQAPQWDAIAPPVSIEHVDRLLIRYQDEDEQWLERWDAGDVLPRRVLMRLWVAGRVWPDIVVAPSAEGYGADVARGEFVHGPIR